VGNVSRIISSVPHYIITFFRKIKLDNFIGGLVVGAIFSLVINLLTVQVQETILRQRSLESLEWEISSHNSLALRAVEQYNTYFQDLDTTGNTEQFRYKSIFVGMRLDTRIWDSAEIGKYLFQIKPEAAANLSAYYAITVDTANSLLEEFDVEYTRLYNEKCSELQDEMSDGYVIDIAFCIHLNQSALDYYSEVLEDLSDSAVDVLAIFHPTQDRLDSFWLKLLLGNESVKNLEVPIGIPSA